MNNLRVIVTFFLLVVVVVLAIFQMQIRGYREVGRINEYVLYNNNEELCIDQTIVIDESSYVIECASQYLLKSGFEEYTVVEALLEEDIVTIEDLQNDLTITKE
jgi:hypothetical protein